MQASDRIVPTFNKAEAVQMKVPPVAHGDSDAQYQEFLGKAINFRLDSPSAKWMMPKESVLKKGDMEDFKRMLLQDSSNSLNITQEKPAHDFKTPEKVEFFIYEKLREARSCITSLQKTARNNINDDLIRQSLMSIKSIVKCCSKLSLLGAQKKEIRDVLFKYFPIIQCHLGVFFFHYYKIRMEAINKEIKGLLQADKRAAPKINVFIQYYELLFSLRNNVFIKVKQVFDFVATNQDFRGTNLSEFVCRYVNIPRIPVSIDFFTKPQEKLKTWEKTVQRITQDGDTIINAFYIFSYSLNEVLNLTVNIPDDFVFDVQFSEEFVSESSLCDTKENEVKRMKDLIMAKVGKSNTSGNLGQNQAVENNTVETELNNGIKECKESIETANNFLKDFSISDNSSDSRIKNSKIGKNKKALAKIIELLLNTQTAITDLKSKNSRLLIVKDKKVQPDKATILARSKELSAMEQSARALLVQGNQMDANKKHKKSGKNKSTPKTPLQPRGAISEAVEESRLEGTTASEEDPEIEEGEEELPARMGSHLHSKSAKPGNPVRSANSVQEIPKTKESKPGTTEGEAAAKSAAKPAGKAAVKPAAKANPNLVTVYGTRNRSRHSHVNGNRDSQPLHKNIDFHLRGNDNDDAPTSTGSVSRIQDRHNNGRSRQRNFQQDQQQTQPVKPTQNASVRPTPNMGSPEEFPALPTGAAVKSVPKVSSPLLFSQPARPSQPQPQHQAQQPSEPVLSGVQTKLPQVPPQPKKSQPEPQPQPKVEVSGGAISDSSTKMSITSSGSLPFADQPPLAQEDASSTGTLSVVSSSATLSTSTSDAEIKLTIEQQIDLLLSEALLAQNDEDLTFADVSKIYQKIPPLLKNCPSKIKDYRTQLLRFDEISQEYARKQNLQTTSLTPAPNINQHLNENLERVARNFRPLPNHSSSATTFIGTQNVYNTYAPDLSTTNTIASQQRLTPLLVSSQPAIQGYPPSGYFPSYLPQYPNFGGRTPYPPALPSVSVPVPTQESVPMQSSMGDLTMVNFGYPVKFCQG